VLSPSAMTIGFDRGVAVIPRPQRAERSASVVPDNFSTGRDAFNLKGRGLVVLTSCSHRGVVNAIKQAQVPRVWKKFIAVIGAFISR